MLELVNSFTQFGIGCLQIADLLLVLDYPWQHFLESFFYFYLFCLKKLLVLSNDLKFFDSSLLKLLE